MSLGKAGLELCVRSGVLVRQARHRWQPGAQLGNVDRVHILSAIQEAEEEHHVPKRMIIKAQPQRLLRRVAGLVDVRGRFMGGEPATVLPSPCVTPRWQACLMLAGGMPWLGKPGSRNAGLLPSQST